jgi:uncharacterized Fe-S cluster-containing radical SAM superfamily enzyme
VAGRRRGAVEPVEELGLRPLGAGRAWGGRRVLQVARPMPLMGHIAFGVIDRGTNVLQVRPTTLCPLSCVFCSVDAGPGSRWRQAEYVVEPEWLAAWVEEAARLKGVTVEALVDGVGDPLTYPWLPRLVRLLKETGVVHSVAAETHGETLTRRLVDRLEEAGLDRVNLSIETLDPEKARRLAATPWYDVERVREVAEYIARETSIDLHVTPVWLPGVNDEDVVEIIEWAYRIGAGKRWPPVTVQKYIRHRRGRHPPGLREPSWEEYWRWIRGLEERTGRRLTWTMEEWGMRRAPRVPNPLPRGARTVLQVAGPGWLRGELSAIKALGGQPSLVHIAQTAGSVVARSAYANAVRAGIGLYGINPYPVGHERHDLLQDLRPALKLISTITKVNQLQKGDQVSYNYTFTAPAPMRVGVLPLGYYEGLHRGLSNVGSVLHHDRQLPIVGRICMNHTMICLDGTDAQEGDEVVVYSDDPQDANSIDAIATRQQLFNYNLLTALSPSVRRIMVQ